MQAADESETAPPPKEDADADAKTADDEAAAAAAAASEAAGAAQGAVSGVKSLASAYPVSYTRGLGMAPSPGNTAAGISTGAATTSAAERPVPAALGVHW